MINFGLSPNQVIMQYYLPSWVYYLIPVLIIWEAAWKVLAIWKAARNNQRYWYIALIFINTIGILPIIYLKFFQKKQK